MKKIAIGLLVLSTSTLALADTKNFAGFNAAIGLGVSQTNFKMSDNEVGVDPTGGSLDTVQNSSADLGTKSKVIPSLELGYNLPIDNKFLLGLSVKYDLTKGPKSNGNGSYSDPNQPYTENSSYSLQQKNHWSIALKPAYAVNDKVMIYAKVAYHNAKSTFNSNYSETGSDPESYNASVKQKGLGLGAGIEYNLSKNMFVQFDVEQIQYKSKSVTNTFSGLDNFSTARDYTSVSSLKPSTTVGTVSIGYRF